MKLGNVLSDVFGASGQAILEALLENLACTVPGIGRIAAASILAEVGMDMNPNGPFRDKWV